MEVELLLEEAGLSKQEALVYTTVLKMGLAKASQIAQKCDIQRGGAYYTLKLLKEKGLISEIIKSGVLYYGAAPPEKILEIIADEKDKKEKAALSVLSQLKEMRQTAIARPVIEIYEGYEGFKTIFNKILERPRQEIRCYMSAEVLDYLPHFHEQFRKRRSEKKIKIRTITERTPSLEEIRKLDKKELRETRFYGEIFSEANLLHYILEDAIVIIKANREEQLGIYIQEKMLAELHKNIFEDLWRKAK